MNYTVPTHWQELNEHHLHQLAPQLLAAEPPQPLAMLRAVFTPCNSWWARAKFYYLLRAVPATELLPYLEFLNTTPGVYHFPEVAGLQKPADRLTSISVSQFSVADTLFYSWFQQRTPITLRQLVAALYIRGQEFSTAELVQVAAITDRLPSATHHRIALAYLSCRLHIVRQFPIVFPPAATPDPEVIVPQFRPLEKKYTPFSEIILSFAFQDPQPLGHYHSVKNTNLYEFLKVFTKSILHHRHIQNEYDKLKTK
ncbi:MAG: hypothetical protein Q4F57_02485 [Weeksellaceae bacterium]|nr:hypothetical protein [Weeksellaceae bacterium]